MEEVRGVTRLSWLCLVILASVITQGQAQGPGQGPPIPLPQQQAGGGGGRQQYSVISGANVCGPRLYAYCCPGWQFHPGLQQCTKPICSRQCSAGFCRTPNTCLGQGCSGFGGCDGGGGGGGGPPVDPAGGQFLDYGGGGPPEIPARPCGEWTVW